MALPIVVEVTMVGEVEGRPSPTSPIRKASLLLGGREKRLGRNRPPQNGVIGGSVAL